MAREQTYNASTGRYAYSSNVSATGKGGSSVSSTVTEGENTDGGTGAQRQTTTTNAQTGVTKTTTKSVKHRPPGRRGLEADDVHRFEDRRHRHHHEGDGHRQAPGVVQQSDDRQIGKLQCPQRSKQRVRR